MAATRVFIAMVRRYIIPCFLIMTISMVSAAIAYKKQKPDDFIATCAMQVQIPLGKDQPPNTNSLQFNSRIAAHEVQLALTSGLVAAVAKAQKVDETEIAGRTKTGRLAGLGSFTESLTSADPKEAVRLVNAVCDELVARVTKQRADEVDGQVKAIQTRIKPIEDSLTKLRKIPPKKRSTQDRLQIQIQSQAIERNTALIGALLSQPPDQIGVLAHATAARAEDHRSKTKMGAIGLVAGALVCFLLVLISEAWRRRAPRP